MDGEKRTDARRKFLSELFDVYEKYVPKIDGYEFTALLFTIATHATLSGISIRSKAIEHMQICIQQSIKTYDEMEEESEVSIEDEFTT